MQLRLMGNALLCVLLMHNYSNMPNALGSLWKTVTEVSGLKCLCPVMIFQNSTSFEDWTCKERKNWYQIWVQWPAVPRKQVYLHNYIQQFLKIWRIPLIWGHNVSEDEELSSDLSSMTRNTQKTSTLTTIYTIISQSLLNLWT